MMHQASKQVDFTVDLISWDMLRLAPIIIEGNAILTSHCKVVYSDVFSGSHIVFLIPFLLLNTVVLNYEYYCGIFEAL